jgi:acetolactate synthase regulatory subunit
MGEPVAALETRRTFLLRVQSAEDALLRVLGPFAVQGAQILSLQAERAGDAMSIRIEAGGVSLDLANQLVERLRGMPLVTQVGVGWRVSPT